LPIRFFDGDDSDAETFSSAVEGPSLDVIDIQKPDDSLPSSVPVDFSTVPESQLTQTMLDHQQLMKDMEVYCKHRINGIVASPTMFQCSQPDPEEEDEEDMELL